MKTFSKPETHPDYFPIRVRHVPGSPVKERTRYLKCSETLCQREEEIPDRGHEPIRDEMVRKKFNNLGWHLGRNRDHDVCPTCIANQRALKRKKVEEPVKTVDTNGTAGHKPIVAPARPAPARPSQEAPRTMDTEDRRVVFTKLNEVWRNEQTGYEAPWTDEKVALSLDCPVAWVVEVRSQFFGEVRDNQEIRDLLTRVETIAAEAKKKVEEAFHFHQRAAALAQEANKLNGEVQDLKRRVEGLTAIAARIERSVK